MGGTRKARVPMAEQIRLINECRQSGMTDADWCRENGMHMSNARNALIGSWNGPAGQAMRSRIIKASGLRDAA